MSPKANAVPPIEGSPRGNEAIIFVPGQEDFKESPFKQIAGNISS